MFKKTYISLTDIGYTFPIKINEKTKWISFGGDQIEFSTSDKSVQEEIEKHPKFLSGEIGIFSSERKSDEKEPVKEPKEFNDVTDLNDAVAVLTGEPYKVKATKLKSKEAVLRVAEELGVSFPNLTVE